MTDAKNEQKPTLTAVKFFCLTLFGLIAIFCEMFLVVPVLSPKTAINMYKTTGQNKTAIATSERIYKKSKKIEDLYNLVLLSDELNDKENLLKYSKLLLEHKNFATFSLAFDEYALAHTDKDKLYLVSSLKSYLMSIRIEYLYGENSEKAFMEAVQCFDENDINVFYFSKYISCILLDNSLSDVKKNELVAQTATATHNDKTIVELLQQRYTDNKPADLANANLLLLEQLWQTKTIEIELLESIDDAALEDAKEELSNLATIIAEKLK